MTESSQAPAAKPESRARNIALRFFSVAPLIPLLLWLMFGGAPLAPWFTLFIMLCVAITAHELFRMTIPESKGLQLWGTLTTCALCLVIAHAPAFTFPALSFIVATSMIAALVVPDPVETAALRSGYLIGGPIYVGALAHILLLHQLPHGGAWVLMSMFLAWLSDTGAYFAGVFAGAGACPGDVSASKWAAIAASVSSSTSSVAPESMPSSRAAPPAQLSTTPR